MMNWKDFLKQLMGGEKEPPAPKPFKIPTERKPLPPIPEHLKHKPLDPTPENFQKALDDLLAVTHLDEKEALMGGDQVLHTQIMRAGNGLQFLRQHSPKSLPLILTALETAYTHPHYWLLLSGMGAEVIPALQAQLDNPALPDVIRERIQAELPKIQKSLEFRQNFMNRADSK